AASPLGTELAARAGGSVIPLSARQAATAARWATRESPLVLGCHAGGATSDPVLVARRNQRWDHCIDLLALAAGAGSGPAARTILDVARPALVALAEAVDGAGTSWDEAHRTWAPVFGR